MYLPRVILFSLLAVLVSTASAVILPTSSHYQGSTYYGYEGDNIRIDFAVYDRDGGNEFEDAGYSAPDVGQYIYAYQIFNNITSSDDYSIDYFAILGIGDGALKDESGYDDPGQYNDHIDIADNPDDDDEIAPGLAYITESSEEGIMGVWDFADTAILIDEHSIILVLVSDHDWTVGTYTFNETIADSVPRPNPEPATILILALGGTSILRKRRVRR